MNISEAIIQCLAEIDRSANTKKTYTQALNLFSNYLASIDITDISNLTMNEFIRFPSWLANQKYAQTSKQLFLSGVRAFLNHLILEDMIIPTEKDMLRLKQAERKVKKHESKLPMIVDEEIIERFIRAPFEIEKNKIAALRNHALVLFLMTSGCRVSEAANLLVKDITSFESDGIRLARVKVIGGKGNKDRNTIISDDAYRALQNYWSARGWQDKNDPAFSRHDKVGVNKKLPMSITSLEEVIRNIRIYLGVDEKVTPHTFRHYFATKLLQETGNIKLVQDFLGHDNPATTQIYAALSMKDKENAYAEIERRKLAQ